MRQISKEAGTAHTYAVQYHFGSMEGLLRAIQRKVIPKFEAVRGAMLAEAERAGALENSRALVEILLRPIVEYRDRLGERSHARYLFAHYASPFHRRIDRDSVPLFDASFRIRELLHLANPHVPRRLVGEGLRLVTIMFLTSIFSQTPPYHAPEFDNALIETAVDMAAGAVMSPVPTALHGDRSPTGRRTYPISPSSSVAACGRCPIR